MYPSIVIERYVTLIFPDVVLAIFCKHIAFRNFSSEFCFKAYPVAKGRAQTLTGKLILKRIRYWKDLHSYSCIGTVLSFGNACVPFLSSQLQEEKRTVKICPQNI
jgi:hypothetical protein